MEKEKLDFVPQRKGSTYAKIKLPNGKYDNLHRYLWKEANGEIPKGCIIHHINGDILDNRLENLQCMTRAEHYKVHKEEKLQSSAYEYYSTYQKQWQKDNKEEWNAYQLKYKKDNYDRYATYQKVNARKFYNENKEEALAAANAYYKENREAILKKNKEKREKAPPLTEEERLARCLKQNTYYKEHKEEINERRRAGMTEEKREKARAAVKEYIKNNPEKHKESMQKSQEKIKAKRLAEKSNPSL